MDERRSQDDEAEDPERNLFEEAMRDVEPLEGRREPVRPPRRAPRRRASRAAARTARFDVVAVGERVEGRVPGFDLRQVGRLKRGELPPEVTVDLHGATSVEARGLLRDALRRARRAGERTVLVIHGRGLRSAAEPVLKTSLPGWLAEPPVGSWVLAFASAPPQLGGPGATLVLLRRRRGLPRQTAG